jgi:O-antigen ligase
VNQANRPKASLGAYLVGAYLFSVPAFAYSESLGLLIIPQITGAILLGYAVFDILGHQSLKIPREIQFYGLLGLWAAITFGLSTSTDDWKSIGTLLKVVTATLACSQLIKHEADLIMALKMFVFSVLVVFYLNRNDLQLLRIADQIKETDRFAGTLANANTAAIFSLTIIWASILLLFLSSKGLFEGALFFAPIALFALIYYSAQSGLIGIGLFVLFLTRLLYIRQTSAYKKSVVILISVLLIVIAGYFIYTSPFFFRMKQLLYLESDSDINRLNLVGEAIQVWLMNGKTFLMGVGYDNFQFFSHLQTYSHSTPLELLASNGIIGLSMFLGFFVLLVRKFVFLYNHALSQKLKSVFFSTLIFLLVFSFFMLAAVMHESRELLPILGSLAAFGQYHVRLLRQKLMSRSLSPVR